MLAPMETGKKLSIAAIAVASVVILALGVFLVFKGHKKKQDETAIVAAVGESTLLLREALGAQGAAGAVARLDAHLSRIKAAERTPLADAAEDYVLGAREIARRRADAARLAPQTAAARQALLAHLAAGGRRTDGWFHRAGELKKRVEDAYYELGVPLKTLDTLLESMYESRKRLGPLVGEPLLIGADALTAARQQVQEELKRSATELERARQIPI
jgi:hypothetical protein